MSIMFQQKDNMKKELNQQLKTSMNFLKATNKQISEFTEREETLIDELKNRNGEIKEYQIKNEKLDMLLEEAKQ